MPIRRGHVAPQNLFIDTIIRRFDGPNRAFVVANAQHDCGVIFVNEGFCRMSGFSRADVMQRPCTCEFLHGPLTSSLAVQQLREALAMAQERLVEILYYKKDGTKFLCQTTLCPIKNEDGDTCMFIVNFQDLTAKPEAEVEEDGAAADTIQSKFNRARASFRQSFRMGSLRRGKTPASGPSTSPGPRMEPILDQPSEEPQEEEEEEEEEEEDEETAHPSREADDGDQRDPLLGSSADLLTTPSATAAAGGAAGGLSSPRQSTSALPAVALPSSVAVAGGASSSSAAAATPVSAAVPTKSPAEPSVVAASAGATPTTLVVSSASDRKPTLDSLHVGRPSLQNFLDDRKTSLPIWRRKDSAASRKDSVATTTSKGSGRVGSFDEEGGRSRSSMRPATSLDAISHHRVSHTGKEFPSRSATISTKESIEDVASESSVSLNSLYPSDLSQPGLSGSRHRPHTLDHLDPAARNNISKPFPNASSESDLSRFRTKLPGRDRKSPSLSNLTAEGIKHKFSFQDPNAAKGLFPNSIGHQKIDKVAQVGQVSSADQKFLGHHVHECDIVRGKNLVDEIFYNGIKTHYGSCKREDV
ncbi:uncharacterized protein [Panulirus ornatus]|uniref:uncharacterized protein n=1 Tax=Panulirus ornatus TaxID=150431 RepID=UPI003A85A61C